MLLTSFQKIINSMPEPLPRHLPSMTALRCFEASARLLSVTRAAAELCLTQSAVSRQIRALEASLGVSLFIRQRQRLQLTPQGARYLQRLTPLLNGLELACRELQHSSRSRLHIGAEPSFTSGWLIPRLPRFRQRYPGIEVELSTDLHALYAHPEQFDLAILYGDGQWDGMTAQLLCDETLIAVRHPQLAVLPEPLLVKGDRPRMGSVPFYDDLRQLLHYPLLHHASLHSSTAHWLQQAGLSSAQIEALPCQRFEHLQQLREAALAGLGASVLPDYLAAPALARGELVQIGSARLLSPHRYYLVHASAASLPPALAAFSHWLLQLAAD